MPEYSWLGDVSAVPLQQAIRHQQTAFSNFFAGRAKFPTFKSKRHKPAATFMNTAFKYRDGKLYMAKSKAPLDVRWSRPLPSAPSSITISRDAAGRYFVYCLCEFEPVSLPITAKTVGIDVGFNSYKLNWRSSRLSAISAIHCSIFWLTWTMLSNLRYRTKKFSSLTFCG